MGSSVGTVGNLVRGRAAARRVGAEAAGSPIKYRLATLVVFAALWETFAARQTSLLIPTFSETVGATVSLIREPETWQAFLLSNQAMVIGFVLSIVPGIPLGFLIGRFPAVARWVDPYINLAIAAPIAGFIPILVMATGIGLTSRVLLIVLFTFPIVVVNGKAGVRSADLSLIQMAQSFGADESQVWRHVLLPGSLPAVMAGVRIGLGRAVTGMVLVELLMVSVGIGKMILQSQGFFQPDRLYATVLLVVFESLLLINGVRLIERRLMPWRARTP